MDDMFGNSDFLQNLLTGTVSAGVGAIAETAKFGYGYVSSPQNRENTAQNAKQFANNFGKYTSNGREFLFSDPAFGVSKYQQNAQTQMQQLQDAKTQRDPSGGRWNVRNQTGFDDESDNAMDDRARSQSQNSATLNRQQRSNDMATPQPKTNIYSSRPSDYSPGEKLISDYESFNQKSESDRYNYNLQSSDRRDATKVNAGVTYQLGSQKNQVDLTVGLDRNAVTRDVGMYSSDNELKASQYKTYSDLQAALNRNQLNSADSRFEASTKYGTQERMNVYNRNTLDKTDIAKAMIQQGTYGRSQADINSKAMEDNARAVNRQYNADQQDFGRYQMEVQKFNQTSGMSERAYSDQRTDMSNARSASMAQYNQDQAFKQQNYREDYRQRQLDRDRVINEFNTRTRQADDVQRDLNTYRSQDLLLRQQSTSSDVEYNRARSAQIYSDTALRNNQFTAGRADISYNRGEQGRFNLAF